MNQSIVASRLDPSHKQESKDQRFSADISNAKFVNWLFIRLIAKGRKFTNVDFRYCTFDSAYLRDCVFDSCNFTGCRFIATNAHGTNFTGCKFDYAIFEKTDIDADILSTGCPSVDNLKARFARSLRVNYQQLGNASAANKAIAVEIDATKAYLYKSWRSNESYYRKKYAGSIRVKQFFRWLDFKALDAIWGNGESALKLVRAVAFIFASMALVDATSYRDPSLIASYWHAILSAPQIFFGVLSAPHYPSWYLTLILFLRLVLFGFFMAIIIKRFSKR